MALVATSITGWSADQVVDALIKLWVQVGWWGVLVLGLVFIAIKHGWPWKPVTKGK